MTVDSELDQRPAATVSVIGGTGLGPKGCSDPAKHALRDPGLLQGRRVLKRVAKITAESPGAETPRPFLPASCLWIKET